MDELYLESHKQLMELVKWIGTPIFVVPREHMEDIARVNPTPGTIITKETAEQMEDFRPFSLETREIILKTFCESHLRLKNAP